MWARIKHWFTAPVFQDDEDKTRQAHMLNVLVNATLVIVLIAAAALPVIQAVNLLSLVVIVILLGVALLTRVLLRRGLVHNAGLLFIIASWLTIAAVFLLAGGIPSINGAYFISISLLAGLVLGRRAMIYSAVAGILLALVTLIFPLPEPHAFPVSPASAWLMLTLALGLGVIVFYLAQRDLEQALQQARRYARDLQAQTSQLELQMQERTRDLAQRSRSLEAATQVARETSAALGNDAQTLARVVSLIQEQFGYEGVGVYFLEPGAQRVTLKEAAGPNAEQQRISASRSPSGGPLVVSWACINQRARRVAGTPNEAALPLMVGGHVLGALYIQSESATALSEDDLAVLLGIADQIAAAIENTRLYQQTSTALTEANTFRQLANATKQGIGMADLNGGLIYANPALLRLLGIDSLSDAVGTYVAQFYPVQARDYFEQEVMPLVLRQGSWSGEINLLSHSGEEVSVLNNIFLVRDETGKPLYIANIVINIAERKEYERKLQETLRETERLYRAVSREGWQTFQADTPTPAFVFDQAKITALASAELQAQPPAAASANNQVKRVPIAVRGQVIGTVVVDDDPAKPLSAEEEDLLQQITEQGAVALEAARLFVQNQRDAAREFGINRIANRLRNARTVDEALTIAVQELRTTTRAARSVLEIKPHAEIPAHSGDGDQARS